MRSSARSCALRKESCSVKYAMSSYEVEKLSSVKREMRRTISLHREIGEQAQVLDVFAASWRLNGNGATRCARRGQPLVKQEAQLEAALAETDKLQAAEVALAGSLRDLQRTYDLTMELSGWVPAHVFGISDPDEV